MADAAFIACDWGTTNLRAWLVGGDGEVLAEREFALGVSKLGPGEAEQRFEREVRPSLKGEGLPAILCGMIGSELGWRAVPHLAAPAGLDNIAAALEQVSKAVWIVPGVKLAGDRLDFMRGEETQVLGVAGGQGEQLLCLPGTHSKWVRVQHGRIVDFFTAVTGEVFEHIRNGGALVRGEQTWSPEAFIAGAALSGPGADLPFDLFQLRAAVLGNRLAPEQAESFLSGLLIGAEVAGAERRLAAAPRIILVGETRLTALYADVLAARGVTAQVADGKGASLAGLSRLAEMMR